MGACVSNANSQPNMGNQSLAQLQDITKQTLLEASKDGVLAKAFASLSEKAGSIEELRLKARNILTIACANGEMDQALRKIDGSEEQVRVKARSILATSCVNGDLNQAIRKIDARG